MTRHGESIRLATRARTSIVAGVLTIITIAFMWWVAVPTGPIVCASSYPAPLNCFMGDRAETALLLTICVAVVGSATMILALLRSTRGRTFAIAGIIALSAAPIVSFALVAWIPGLARV